MLLDLDRFSFSVFLKEIRLLTALALPMLLAQVAQVGIGFVDTVMAGGAGKEDLAAVALGSSAFATVYITFMGIMAALNPMIAQLYGAGKTGEAGETGRQGIWFGLILGIFGMILMWAAITPFRNWLTLSDYVEGTMAQYMLFTSLAMPAAMVHRALHAYASSLNRPRLIMLVSFAAFVLNVPLNYIFVYGKFGMPALGGAGCGVATMAVFWFSALALWIYIAKEKFFRPFGLTAKFGKPDWAVFKQIWKIGAPIGLSYFLEASAFSFIVFLIAPFGEDYVAAQQVGISLSGILYMIPQSVGSAGTVRIGFSLGRREFSRARYISGVSLVSGWVLAVITVLSLVLFRSPLASMYNDDPAVLSIASTVLLFACCSNRQTSPNVSRPMPCAATKPTKVPMFIHAAAFWGCAAAGLSARLPFRYGHLRLLDGIDCLAHHRSRRLGVVLGKIQYGVGQITQGRLKTQHTSIQIQLKLKPCNPSDTEPTSPPTTLSACTPKPGPLSRLNTPTNCATSSDCPSSTAILFYGWAAAATSF